MSFRALIGAVLALFCVLLAPSARAEEFTRKSFLMPKGSFEITGSPARPALLGISASEGRFGKPIWIAPNFYWAVSDDLSLGISHQRGLCFNDCGKVYNDAGFDLILFLTGSDRFELDLHAGVPIHSFDPFFVGMQGGVLGRVNIGSVTALVFDPSLYIGFSGRDRGNREALSMPFWFYFQATDVVVPFVGSGLHGPLDGFFDAFAVPLEAGVLFDVTHDIDLGFSMRFPNLLGHGGTGDARDLLFLARFRF
jgi:hypothetical protein